MDNRGLSFRPGLWTGMFWRHGLSFGDTVRHLAAAGFECSEICQNYALALRESGAYREGPPGLPMTQCHLPNLDPALSVSGHVADFRQWLPLLSEWKIGCCVLHPLAGEPRASLETFRALVTEAAPTGVRIAVENLIGYEGRRLADLLDLVPGLGVNLDSAHACANGESPAELARFFTGRIFGVHLSDSDGGAADLHLTPGRGIVDWPDLLAALRAAEYPGDFHMELPHERRTRLADTDAAARTAFTAVKAWPRDASTGEMSNAD